jgi:hypothetical protein
MKKRMSVLLSVLLIGTVIISHVACAQAKENIVGKWQWQSGSDNIDSGILEIYDNNTFKGLGRYILGGNGNLDLLKDGRIQFRDTMGNMLIGKLADDKLQIETPGNKYEYYNRYKKYEESQYENEIIGTWQYQSDNKKFKTEITFNKDKTMEDRAWYPGLPDPLKHTYQYNFIDKNRIQTTQPWTYKIHKLTSDQLILYDGDSTKGNTYKRISQ